jgi:UDP-3-O-[3-hydroxymyristoyl] glucosamine N-acyltransferase
MKTIIEISELIGSLKEPYRIRGKVNGKVRNIRSIDCADGESLSFCRYRGEQALAMIRNSKAKVVICTDELEIQDKDYRDKVLIQVPNPRLTISRILAKYYLVKARPGIHDTAIISEGARIGERVHIGPGCCINDCEIGDDTFIEGQVYIGAGVKIGKSVIIHPGVIIGTEAISFTRNEKKELEWFPQLGGVIIEDNVEIGAKTVVAKGPLPLNDTVIGEGSKLDILVEIGHGVNIGKHCIIVGHTILCGRVKIGDYTQISCQVCIKEGVTIGSRVLVGMGAVVISDMPDSMVVVGCPAKPIRVNTV